MSYLPDQSPIPNSVQQVASALRTTGWICFWIQLVLGVISAVIQLFAILVFSRGTTGTTAPSSGIGGGLVFALIGLGILGFSIFQAFGYTRLARRLKAPGITRPSRGETFKRIRTGLTSNLTGMTVTLIASEAINGILLAKAISQPRGLFNAPGNLQDFVQPLDFFVVLANTHTIVAHFVGIAGGLWLINRIYKN
ncbi:DUF3611 family protein [Planktothrix agardhii]|jgi:hypothetical protein|uniref:DUF3611 family protein n=2 Tax=Planktothrix agardhii TaxID=1160 RepID=A0A073CGV8_PLAA1|nr:DUF3611 family protein [Planktothrix agardhii]CAH2575302.1 hypothetical protein PRNO82_04668 [Planktothrix rubescens]BBD56670.1 hypothetical protein NIES204_40030 [Planktothrix agardhii NIES-204]KEI67549.1 hypothetical protein A19Y_2661 [Planktothrix agardhii NIVA-CYA 126/8]MBG0746704.1 DUF3611 family protein [Planktothrix agardhii KL2]MCB8750883.1 DUF3611 family protein [Planktothrix agardhii 1810]